MFQIVLAIPRFDNFDSICGWSYRRLPMAYRSRALASKLASRMADGTDETSAAVVPYGAIVDAIGNRMTSTDWNHFGTVAADEPGPYGDYIPF